MNVPLCPAVSSLRSVDSPGLFLALVVCGDGHCWCRFHGCAHGCLRGQAAAKGDKIRVRRQFCSTWVEGRHRITVPNQSLVVFSSLTFLLHVWGHSRAEDSKKKIKTHQLSHSLCVFIHFCIDREAFEPMMESGELVVRYRARRTYSRRTTEATCEFTALAPRPAQNNGISNICAWLSLQQWEMCLSACTNLPLSG